jgi:protein CpxP
MKKLILSIAFFVAVTGATFAQKKTAEERATKSTEMMEKNLSLTADQKTTIYNATVEKTKAIDALREAAGEGNKPDADQMKAVNQKFSKVLKETLTDEQKAKMAEMKAANAAQKEAPKQ